MYKMKKQLSYRFNLPPLSGGINSSSSTDTVADNQLTKCKNMWFDSGAIKTRPGLKADFAVEINSGSQIGGRYADTECIDMGNLRKGDGRLAKVFILKTELAGDFALELLIIDITGSQKRLMIDSFNAVDYGVSIDVNFIVFAGSKAGCIYIPVGIFDLSGNLIDRKIYEANIDLDECRTISTDEIYAPLILINGKGDGYSPEIFKYSSEYPAASRFEGFNMLTGAFRASYKTDGVSSVFALPVQNLTANENEKIEITLNQRGGSSVFTILHDSDTSNIIQYGSGAIWAEVDRVKGLIKFMRSATGPSGGAEPNPPDFVHGCPNNLIIKAWKTDLKAVERFYGMKFAAGYSGTRISGGARVFLSGNELYKGLICWSNPNMPLYFSENNCAFIGDSSQGVTAFAKQGDKLIIFKSHEIFYISNIKGGVTSEDILSGKVTRAAKAADDFPITQLHAHIGCDCPATIQLCANGVVFASSDKRVYAISADRDVTELSYPVKNELDIITEGQFEKAFGLVYNGQYMLIVGGMAYLLNCQCRAPQWHIWDFSIKLTESGVAKIGNVAFAGGINNGRECTLILRYSAEYIGSLQATVKPQFSIAFKVEGDTDSGINVSIENGELNLQFDDTDIESHFTTKLFDLGKPEILKVIEQVYIDIKVREGSEVSSAYVTDMGISNEGNVIVVGDMVRLNDKVSRYRQLGISLRCKGVMAVNGITMRYKLMGSVK